MKRDKEGKETPTGHQMARDQFGDNTLGDMNGTGIRRVDPEQFPGENWQAFASDQFVDSGAGKGPTMKDRAAGYRAVKQGQQGNR